MPRRKGKSQDVADAVLLPVYNEAETVCSVLDSVREHFEGEVIVIDDGSDDGSNVLLAERGDVALISLDHNCGYGCALRIGFDVARDMGYERVLTMDCDGQHEPAHIPEFLRALGDGCDIISGSRYLPGSGVLGSAPADRREINARITEEINKVTGFGITDAFCGFKAYKMSALSLVQFTEPGYAMPLELWAKAWHLGLKVCERPVERIYCARDRTFGANLDNPEARYAYYMDVWHRALGDG